MFNKFYLVWNLFAVLRSSEEKKSLCYNLMFQIFNTQSTWRTMVRWACWWARSKHLSWGHHMSRSSLGPFFHSAEPTFSHQSLHHFSNCTSLSVVIVSGTRPSLFLEHDLHCFVLSGFGVNHSSTTTNWVAGILCKVFWVDLEFGDGGWWLWYYAFGIVSSDEFFLSHFLQALSREPKFNHTSSIAWSDCPP